MLTVLQFCVDANTSSGVNCFCTNLNDALNASGAVKSLIIRDASSLSNFSNFSSLSNLSNVSNLSNLIIHIHGIWRRQHHLAARWARSNGVPIVWSTHGMTAPWAMRHKWWKKRLAWWIYQRQDLRCANVIHCTTEMEVEWNREKVQEDGRFVVAPLGVNEEVREVREVREVFWERPFIVLFVGRVHPVKGLENAIRAMAEIRGSKGLSGSRGWEGIQLRIVGPDEGGYRRTLLALCNKLGLSANVSNLSNRSNVSNLPSVLFVGEKHGAELGAEYSGCDVLVLPSFTENFGGVVIDALAHGKPVIASRTTPWKCLADERVGWWVDNSPECLAKTIAEVMDLPREMLREMGERGRTFVSANYTWEAVARKMAACYEGLRVNHE